MLPERCFCQQFCTHLEQLASTSKSCHWWVATKQIPHLEQNSVVNNPEVTTAHITFTHFSSPRLGERCHCDVTLATTVLVKVCLGDVTLATAVLVKVCQGHVTLATTVLVKVCPGNVTLTTTVLVKVCQGDVTLATTSGESLPG